MLLKLIAVKNVILIIGFNFNIFFAMLATIYCSVLMQPKLLLWSLKAQITVVLLIKIANLKQL